MGTAPVPILDHPCPLAKIDLRLLSRLTLHSPKRQWIGLLQLAHEALHRIVAAGELLLAHQVLMNPLSGQAGVQTGFDESLKRLAVTDSARLGPGGRNGWVWPLDRSVARCRNNLRAGGHTGWVWCFDRRRPGGRNGWVWLLHLPSQSTVSSDGFAVDSQFARYPAL